MFRAHFAHHQEVNDVNFTYAGSNIVLDSDISNSNR